MIKATNSTTSRRALLAGAPAPQASRRGLLMGLAAAVAVPAPAIASIITAPVPSTPVAAAAMPAAATPSPDEALLLLFDQYMAANAEYRRLYAIYERGRDEHQAKHPMLDVLLVQPSDAELGLPEVRGNRSSYEYSIMELERAEWAVFETIDPPEGLQWNYCSGGVIVRWEPPSAAARARADEIIKAHNRWHRKYWREPREVRAIERQSDRASNLKEKLHAKIDRTRAHTVAGLAAKGQVAAIEGEEDTQFADTTLDSILRDMKALKKAVQS